MPDRQYSEPAFYDFERNYDDAVALVRSTFGDARADVLADARGAGTRRDFMTAVHWGWMLHRPVLSTAERALVLIGNEAAKGQVDALLDHAQLALSEGLHREQVLEAIFTLSVYSGIPTCQRALDAVEAHFAELDRAGWQPRVPPGPLQESPEHNFYDFEQNFTDGVDLSLANFGSRGGDRESRLARMGQSSVGDFGAIHWGWIMHRPFLSSRQRCLVLIGSDTANKGYLALKDHLKWGLREGMTRDDVNEAIFMLYVFNGWPANRQSAVTVAELFEELDKANA